jgi:hypothetical protein
VLHVLLNGEVDVCAQLFIKVGIELAEAEEGGKAGDEGAKESIGNT